MNSFCNYFVLSWLNFKSILKKERKKDFPKQFSVAFCKWCQSKHYKLFSIKFPIWLSISYMTSLQTAPTSTMLTVFFHCNEIRFIFWKIPKFILWKFNCVDADILYECLLTFMKQKNDEKRWNLISNSENFI